MQSRLYFSDKSKRFLFECDYQSRHLPRNAGFKWDGTEYSWYTKDPKVAAKLRRYATDSAQDHLPREPEALRPWQKPLPSPPSGLKLFPHQERAIKFALSRKHSYLALEPGLGKTICAAVIAQVIGGGGAVVYICPPFLVRNVEEELKRWAPHVLVYILPDTQLAKVTKEFCRPPVLFVDEAHRFSNPKAKRTKDLFRLAKEFGRVVYLSGTPMRNRPMELYSILSHSAPDLIDHMTQFQFGVRYCAGRKGYWGWDFSGASHVEELVERIRPFMLRMRKVDVLDLPPKIEEVFTLSTKMSAALSKLETGLKSAYQNVQDLMKVRIGAKHGVDEDELPVATYRRLLGLEKVKPVVEYVRSLLDGGERGILLYAYHQEVLDRLQDALAEYLPFVIVGDTSHKKRHAEIKEFQNSEWPLVIANYACAVGFNAFKATRVLFCEYSWVPGDNQQAIDRCHRIGTTSTVFVQYAAFPMSLDMRILNTLTRKSEIISKL